MAWPVRAAAPLTGGAAGEATHIAPHWPAWYLSLALVILTITTTYHHHQSTMGATNSRPATTPTPPVAVEKPGFPRDDSSHSQHHSADRLQRIAAENDIKTSSSTRSASATVDVASYKEWQKKIENDPVSRLAALTLHNTNIKESLRVRKSEVEQMPIFNVMIEHDSKPITDQKSR